MNTYFLSNTNIDSLKYYLDKEISFLGSCHYGNYLIDLIDTNSELYQKDIDLVILLLDGRELENNADLIQVFNAVEEFLKLKECLFLFSTVVLRPNYIDSLLNESNYFEFNANKEIIEFQKSNKNILILDVHKLILMHGSIKCFDDKFWYLGRIRYSDLFFRLLSEEISKVIAAYTAASKKILVLDSDNTIWGGVIGEDGDNIQLSNEGQGRIYTEIQKNIRRLLDYGVLLAINSKNNYSDVIKGLEHPGSILCKEDFVVIKANWKRKDVNLIEISNALNIGLDSFVFLDDSYVERELIKQNLPDVSTPEFPEDLDIYNEWFISEVVNNFFPRVTITSEDKLKNKQYSANNKREELKSKNPDLTSFLSSLKIKINVSVNSDKNIERLAQLSQKTNQFNLTLFRYNNHDIARFVASDSFRVYELEYQDKFLKEGIVGLAIIEIKDKKAIFNSFLLSCRILGRNIEELFFKEIYKDVKNMDVNTMEGIHIENTKNLVAKDFYIKLGFVKISVDTYQKNI